LSVISVNALKPVTRARPVRARYMHTLALAVADAPRPAALVRRDPARPAAFAARRLLACAGLDLAGNSARLTWLALGTRESIMEFDNSFEVPLPPAQAWKLLLDVERIAPCMPGRADRVW
jgi:hypothetical protein